MENLPRETQTNNPETYCILLWWRLFTISPMFWLARPFVSADPNVILPIGLLLGGATFLFILSVVIYRLFEMDIVLWFRRAFPVLYANIGKCQPRLPPALLSRFLCTCRNCVSSAAAFVLHPTHNGSNVWKSKKHIQKLKSLQNAKRPPHKTWPRVNVDNKKWDAS